MSMRLRTIRRELARVLGRGPNRKLKELQRRANELGQAFRELNAAIPSLNAAADAAGEDCLRLAQVLRDMAANRAASSIVLSRWADALISASKLIEER
jgi:hypothetical protein